MKQNEYKNEILKKKIEKIKEPKLHAIIFSGGDHLQFRIICGTIWGSVAVQFVDHSRSGDHLRSGIICGAVQS